MASLSSSSDICDEGMVPDPAKSLLESHKNNECQNFDADVDLDRTRKTSGNLVQSFITRNGFKVEKLPTFHHLHISDLSHKVLDFQDKMHSEFVRQWRSVVTGDPNK